MKNAKQKQPQTLSQPTGKPQVTRTPAVETSNSLGKSARSEVLFRISDDALIVANTGVPFSRKGVIGVCAMNLGEKREKKSHPKDTYNCKKSELVDNIARAVICMYKVVETGPNLLIEHENGEEEVSKGYGGRFAWELLQNADDATGGGVDPQKLIGAKGLGFKSVLEITEEPEIYSGPFRFCFSKRKTRKSLGLNEDKPCPAFRVPHHLDEAHEECKKLCCEYATVIRLPFLNDEAKEKARERLGELQASCLLLCQHLTRITIEICDESQVLSRVLEIDRGESNDFAEGDNIKMMLTERCNNAEQKCTEWRRWLAMPKSDKNAKRLSVAICLPVEKGKVVACPVDGTPPLHVFFPTNHVIKVPALIHASYDLEGNRKRIASDQPNQKAICDAFEKLLEKMLKSIPVDTSLSVFGEISASNYCDDTDDNASDTGAITRMKQSIAKTVRETEFVPVIGGARVKPGEVQLWRHGLGHVLRANCDDVSKEKLLSPKLISHSKVLDSLGATPIECEGEYEQHASLLQYCKCDSADACFEAWHIANDLVDRAKNAKQGIVIAKKNRDDVLDQVKKAPLWWLESQTARASEVDGKYKPLKKRQKEWPQWLKVDVLDATFVNKIAEHTAVKKDGDENHVENHLDSLLLSGKNDYFHALLRYCEQHSGQDAPRQKWWAKHGTEILSWVRHWGISSHTNPLIIDKSDIPSDRDRNRAGQIIHLPTDKGWLPAVDCYAGQSWDGLSSFDKYFKENPERGVLKPFKKWPSNARDDNDCDVWKNILRYLGVSWEPKVREENGDYVLEHFPNSVAGSKPKDIILGVKRAWDVLPQIPQEGPRGGWRPSRESRAHKQIRKESWLPCTKALLGDGKTCKPSEAFMPDAKLSGNIVPKVRKSDKPDNPDYFSPTEWGEIHPWLVELKVKENLPNNKDSDWWQNAMCKLHDAVAKQDQDHKSLRWDHKKRGELASIAYSLCKEFNASLEFKHVPYVRISPKGEFIALALFAEVFHADRSYHDDSTVRRELLEKGYKLFPFFLSKGEDFGLQKLSFQINEEVVKGEVQNRCTSELRRRYEKREKMFALIPGVGKIPEHLKSEHIVGYSNLSLKLTNKETGKDIAEIDVDSWPNSWDGESTELCINTSGDVWSALAIGLATVWDKKPYIADFQVLLMQENDDACIKILRDRYNIPESALEYIKPIFDYSQDDLKEDGVDAQGSSQSPDDDDKRSDEKHVSSPDKSNDAHSVSTRPLDEAHGHSRHKSRYSSGQVQRSGGGNNSHSHKRGTEAQDAGINAERWLSEQLVNAGYDIQKIHEGRDFDICKGVQLICKIEVKHTHIESDVIYLSQVQIDAARRARHDGKKYYVAVLQKVGDESGANNPECYQVFWFFNPLTDLCINERKWIREWTAESERGDMDEGLWDIPVHNPATKVLVKEKTPNKVEIPVGHLLCESRCEKNPGFPRLKEQLDSAP